MEWELSMSKFNNKITHVCFDTSLNKLVSKELSFEDCQSFVGGYLTNARIGKNLYVYIHESGQFEKSHLPVEITLKDKFGEENKIVLYGNIIFLKYNGDDRATSSFMDLWNIVKINNLSNQKVA